jgi:UDP-N-acetylmuramate: L-alanyl-gamma-D-glutamyl-meso-diaminopimelate ligase
MRMGVHQDTLATSLSGADDVWLYAPADIGWNTDAVVAALGSRGHASHDIDTLARDLARAARSGDHVLIMSNGGFGGLHGKLLAELERNARDGAS